MAFGMMRRRTPTQACDRCGLRYKINQQACPHCAELDELGVALLKQRHKREMEGNARLGGKLLLVAVVGMAFIVLLAFR